MLISSPSMPRMTKWVNKSNPRMMFKGSLDEMSNFTPEEKEEVLAEIMKDEYRIGLMTKLLEAGDGLAAFP